MSTASAVLLATLQPQMSTHALFATAIFVGASVATWNGIYLAEIAALVPGDNVSEATAAATFFVFSTYMVTPPIVGLIVRFSGYAAAYSVSGCASFLAFSALLYGYRTSQST
jgi:hypothetical protein